MEKEKIDAQLVFKGEDRWLEPDQGRERGVTGEGCRTGPACCQAQAQRQHSPAPGGLETVGGS